MYIDMNNAQKGEVLFTNKVLGIAVQIQELAMFTKNNVVEFNLYAPLDESRNFSISQKIFILKLLRERGAIEQLATSREEETDISEGEFFGNDTHFLIRVNPRELDSLINECNVKIQSNDSSATQSHIRKLVYIDSEHKVHLDGANKILPINGELNRNVVMVAMMHPINTPIDALMIVDALQIHDNIKIKPYLDAYSRMNKIICRELGIETVFLVDWKNKIVTRVI